MAITDSDKMFKQYQNEMESTIRQWSSTWEAEPEPETEEYDDYWYDR